MNSAAICREFDGGGHVRASGCRIFDTIQNAEITGVSDGLRNYNICGDISATTIHSKTDCGIWNTTYNPYKGTIGTDAASSVMSLVFLAICDAPLSGIHGCGHCSLTSEFFRVLMSS